MKTILALILLISTQAFAQSLIGSGANQVPTNGLLGTMAFEDNKNYTKTAGLSSLFVEKGLAVYQVSSLKGWTNNTLSVWTQVTDGIMYGWGKVIFTGTPSGSPNATIQIPEGHVLDGARLGFLGITNRLSVGSGTFSDKPGSFQYPTRLQAVGDGSRDILFLRYSIYESDLLVSPMATSRFDIDDEMYFEFVIPVREQAP